MLNMNEKMECMENEEKSDTFEKETQNRFVYDNSDYNVNFFGVGRGTEDLQ